MDTKRKALLFLVALFLLLGIIIFYIMTELYTESDIEVPKTDAIKFKEEYENLNDKQISLKINEKNPIKYKTADEIISDINDKKSFIIYFGYPECSYCRYVMNDFLNTISEKEIQTVYYLNIKDMQDIYELDDDHNPIKTKEGNDDYYKLLEAFDNVLDYYTLNYEDKNGKKIEVKMDEKRIYAPTYIIVENGNPIKSTKDVLEFKLENELKEDLLIDSKNIFLELLKDFKVSNTCSIENKEC